MSSSSPIDVLLAMRACAGRYQEIVSQANILVEHGLRVMVADITDGASTEPGAFDSRVVRQSARTWGDVNGPVQKLIKRWQEEQSFIALVARSHGSYQPKIAIAYDWDSCLALAGGGTPQTFIICDFVELPDPRMPLSFPRRFKLNRLFRLARHLPLIVFPDPYRAAIFAADANINSDILVVPNCPRLTPEVGKSDLRDRVQGRFGGPCQIVLHVGGVTANRQILNVVRSMCSWPERAVLVCRGNMDSTQVSILEDFARQGGMGARLFFDEVRSYTRDSLAQIACSDLGLAMYGKQVLNQRYMAFASNKVFQYMAAGIPQVTSQGPGFDELISMSECGFCVDVSIPEQIGQAVNKLLNDSARRQTFGQNGRRLHLTRFNYEKQFAPVLEAILDQVGAGR